MTLIKTIQGTRVRQWGLTEKWLMTMIRILNSKQRQRNRKKDEKNTSLTSAGDATAVAFKLNINGVFSRFKISRYSSGTPRGRRRRKYVAKAEPWDASSAPKRRMNPPPGDRKAKLET